MTVAVWYNAGKADISPTQSKKGGEPDGERKRTTAY
jgi:hypothetical protein